MFYLSFLILGTSLLMRRFDYTDGSTLLYTRIISGLLYSATLSCLLLILHRIYTMKNSTSTITVKKSDLSSNSIESYLDPESSTTMMMTVQAYDMKFWQQKLKEVIMSMIIMTIMHLKMDIVIPIVIAPSNTIFR